MGNFSGEEALDLKGLMECVLWRRLEPNGSQYPKLVMQVKDSTPDQRDDPGPGPGLREVEVIDGRKIWIAEDDKSLRLWRPGLSLDVDFENCRAQVYLAEADEWNYAHRVIYSLGFLEIQGVLLHASSVVRNGKAYIFPGPSGAGKTTVALNSPGMPILSDEVVGVQLPPNNSHPLAWGTPFFGDWGRPGEEMSAPIKGFYFPVKSLQNRVEPLRAAETLDLLLPCVWSFTTWEPRLRRMFEITVQLAEQIPGYLLHCRPEPSLWEVLDET